MSGKLIVIDGGDGAGKATQVALLVKRLETEGHTVETLDFPQYTQNTFGKLLRECLDGKRGDFMKLDAKIVSVLFAADRFETKQKLEGWLNEGKVVVLDRYVSANMMHQAARIENDQEAKEFVDWLDTIEFDIFKIPRPDQIVYLQVSHTTRAALKSQAVAEGKHGGTMDVAEKDQKHQRAAEKRAREIVADRGDWQAVICDADGEMRTREAIHEDVYNIVQEKLQ